MGKPLNSFVSSLAFHQTVLEQRRKIYQLFSNRFSHRLREKFPDTNYISITTNRTHCINLPQFPSLLLIPIVRCCTLLGSTAFRKGCCESSLSPKHTVPTPPMSPLHLTWGGGTCACSLRGTRIFTALPIIRAHFPPILSHPARS